jgi:DNA-binding transcriptional LysR family regulator
MQTKQRHADRTDPIAPRGNGWALGLEVRHLRAFVTLVDEGSMTAVAHRLGVAQSTISEALTALERAVGTRVVARRRGVHTVDLTPAGQALLPYGRTILASLEDAHVAVAEVARDVPGRVEIIANESVSTYLLAPALDRLRARWPNMQFAVSVGVCQHIVQGFMDGQFDLGVMLQCPFDPTREDGLVLPPAVQARSIAMPDVPLVVFANANHPLAGRHQNRVLPVESLAPYTVFISDASGHFHDLIRRFFCRTETTGPRMEATGSVEAVKRSILANAGAVGVLPGFAIADELRSGVVHSIPLRPALPLLQFRAMVYRTRAPKHPVIADLVEMLGAHHAIEAGKVRLVRADREEALNVH